MGTYETMFVMGTDRFGGTLIHDLSVAGCSPATKHLSASFNVIETINHPYFLACS